jgi:hypothetical protein
LKTSTASVKVRCSAGCSAPTPTTFRVISSPFSFRIETITEYSQDSPTAGCLMVPSTLSGTSEGWAR